MYCPKCGVQDQDDLAFCRDCGEDLKAISQVLKKHLPITVISKFDALIEKKNERFRRDAVLNAAMGSAFLLATCFMPFGGNVLAPLNLFLFALGVFSLLTSFWYFLAYQRSLESKTRSSESSAISASQIETRRGVEGTTQEIRPIGTGQDVSQWMYCPRCGLQSPANASYCRGCQTSLVFRSPVKGLGRYLPGFVLHRLDDSIAKNEEKGYKPQYKSGWSLVAVAGIFLLNVVLQGLEHNWGNMTIQLLIGVSLLVSAGWNLIAYRRNAEKELLSSGDTSNALSRNSLTAFPRSSRIAAAAILMSLALIYTGTQAGWAFEWIFIAVAFLSFIVIVANWVRSWHDRRDKEFFQEGELDGQNVLAALPFSEPASITEANTMTLDPVTTRIDRQKADVSSGELISRQS